MSGPRLLDAAATAAALPWLPLLDAIESAAHRLHAGEITAPERAVLALPGGRYLVMPAVDAQLAITKLVSVHLGNPVMGLPAIHGQVFVADAVTGLPLLVLDGPTVTARRTAAVSLVGMRALHPGPIARVAIVGAGVQAFAHAVAVHEVFGASVHVVARDLAKGEGLCACLRAEGVDASVVRGVEEVADDDVIVTATTSQVPVLPDVLPAATLVVAVGAFTREMAEVPPAMVHHRQVVVDTIDGARHEAGDLIQAGVSWPRVHSLAVMLAGERHYGDVVFKTVGHAAWDLAAAGVALAASS